MPDPVVRKLHQLFDEAAQEWFDIYEALGIEGNLMTAEVPRQDQRIAAVRGALLARGAQAPIANDETAIAAAIATEAPVVRRASHTGWRDSNRLFVGHRYVVGDMESGMVLSPQCSLLGVSEQIELRGTLDGWRNLVSVARHSTAMIVALCAAFAAPLLALVERPSFALVFHGPSRAGKSFAQLAAASALGFGREKDLPSLNATPAGLLAAALAFNDHMLPINEIGTARGRKSEVYVVLRDTTYALLNGQDTIRHPSWSGAGSNATSTFQVVVLLSSEISPDVWAARNGETRDDGEMARLIGLPVLAPERLTIFDRPPSDLSGDALSAWEKAQFTHLRNELPNQRGIAFRKYTKKLTREVDVHTKRARHLIKIFEASVARPTMTPVARDIVAKFGVLFAAGVIAHEIGVLPIEGKVVGRAMRRACLAALAELPDTKAELQLALNLLKDRLAAGSIVDIDNYSNNKLRVMHNADGFRKKRGDGEEFVVRAQVFTGWFSTALRARLVLEWLDDEGFLLHQGTRSRGRSNEWAQKQTNFPDATRVRSISIYFPRGLTNLDQAS